MYDIIDYIRETIEGLGYTVTVGPMPTGEGVGIYTAAGNIEAESLLRSSVRTATVAVNGKSRNQKTAMQMLEAIHAEFNAKLSFIDNTEIQIASIRTNTAPTYTGMQSNEWYLYGSSLRVNFFYKRTV